MKIILFGLLQGLGGWAAVSALIWWYLQSRGMRPSDAIGIAIFSGGFMWASFGLFVSAFGRWRERAAILGGITATPPVDGKHVVLVGTIEPTGPRLQAPLDGSPCVMYSYGIHIDTGTGKSRMLANVARGVALTPSRIVTRAGTYKLLALVYNLQAESPTNSSAARVERFLQYARRTTFIKGERAANELLAQWSDDDGAYRSDVAYIPLEDPDTQYWITEQHHVPPGARVCLFGLYSKAKGGIIPSVARPPRLICGNIEEAAATLKSQVVTRSIIALFLAAPWVIAFVVNQ